MKDPTKTLAFSGDEFFGATAGLDCQTQMSYLRAVWHYWRHTRASGLPDDDDYLRRVCGCEAQDWPRVKRLLFGAEPFFVLDDGRWHQRQVKEQHDLVWDRYQRRVERAKQMTRQRMARANAAHGESKPANGACNNAVAPQRNNVVAPPCNNVVAPGATAPVNGSVRCPEHQPDSRVVHAPADGDTTTSSHPPGPPEITPEDAVARPEDCAEVPNWTAVQMESARMGLPEWRAKDWYDQMESVGWRDAKGRRIVRWQYALRRVKTWWESEGKPATPPTTKTPEPESSYTRELRAITERCLRQTAHLLHP